MRTSGAVSMCRVRRCTFRCSLRSTSVIGLTTALQKEWRSRILMHGGATTRHPSSFSFLSWLILACVWLFSVPRRPRKYIFLQVLCLVSLDESLSYYYNLTESWPLLTVGVAVVWKFSIRIYSFNLFGALLILRVVLLCISAMYVMPLLSCLTLHCFCFHIAMLSSSFLNVRPL